MKKIFRGVTKTFLLGVFTLIPSVLTFWLLWLFVTTIDHLFKQIFFYVLPAGIFWPGFGLFVAILLCYIIGIAMQATALPRFVKFLESILSSIPLIKTLYWAFKDFSVFLSGKRKESPSRMVMVRIPNSEHRALGMVTHEFPGQDLGIELPEKVLVYFPMSYQIGGYTLLVSSSEVEPLNLPVDAGMRYILTAGISNPKH